MRRGRKTLLGGAIAVAALALAVPALGATGSTFDQGYPCATQPPAGPGQVSGTDCNTQPQCPAGQTMQNGTCTTPHTAAPTKVTQPSGTGGVAGTVHSNGVAPVRATGHAGELPFTGSQLLVFVLVGLGLIGGGLLLRVALRPAQDDVER